MNRSLTNYLISFNIGPRGHINELNAITAAGSGFRTDCLISGSLCVVVNSTSRNCVAGFLKRVFLTMQFIDFRIVYVMMVGRYPMVILKVQNRLLDDVLE